MFNLKNHQIDSFFCDIDGKKLDKEQIKAVKDENKELLVIAGAGSGKTLTIVGKVKYLIEKLGYQEDEILCLSFTNETVNSLKEKIPFNVDIYTFHKLALNILKNNNYNYTISQEHLLSYIINEYFYSFVNKTFLEHYFNDAYSVIINSEKLIRLKELILTFIHKIKCNNITVNEIKLLRTKVDEHQTYFLLFALEIFLLYEEELLSYGRIDFDDMILLATNHVKTSEYIKKYRYIIIDEYQDISLIRFNLIYEILKRVDAKIMCVGDDYQAIYGFSGSNVSLFVEFFKYFPKAKQLILKNTYRNSYELIKTSCKFVMKNPFQIRKHIYANFFCKNPIVLVYYDNNYLDTYYNLLNYLYLENQKEIMILARYNKDLDEVRKREHKGINLSYLTVHMSKGLESENVILLKMQDDYLGFPSKIQDDTMLELLNKNKKEMEYAEERRLFYVALTRTKKRIYILVPRNNPSIFIKEIKRKCVELLFK